MRDQEMDPRTEEALARYLAVAPWLRSGRQGRGKGIRALSSEPIPWHDGTYRRRSVATLYRYLKRAREHHLAGVYRQQRADKGKRTAIPPEVFRLCCALREKFPDMGSRQIKETLLAEGVPGAEAIALSTLRRWLREEHLPRTRRKGAPEPQALVRFECDRANELWLADATPGVFLPHPQRPGKFRATQLLIIEDGFSRRLVGGGFFWNQQLPALDDALFRATLRWGIPEQIHVDRGNIFVSRHFRRVCADLGIGLIHAQTARAKGKIERLIRTSQEETFASLRDLVDRGEVTDLTGLNAVFWRWAEDSYHQRVHSETGATPAQRLIEPVHPVRDAAAHQQIFLWQLPRTVRRAGGTFTLFGNTYEVSDRSLAGLQVQVHFNPYNLQTVAVWYQGRFRQTVTAGTLHRSRHPEVSPLPDRGPVYGPTTLNMLSGLQRRAHARAPEHPVSFSAPEQPPVRLADVLRDVLHRDLTPNELQSIRRHWQRYGPFDPQVYLPVLERFVELKGSHHHISVYLELCRSEGDWS